MRKAIFTLTAILSMVFTVAPPLSAKEKGVAMVAEEKAPQIIEFPVSWDMRSGPKAAKKTAITQANTWMRNNSRYVTIISHSTSENSLNPTMRGTDWTGSYTVTVLYVDK